LTKEHFLPRGLHPAQWRSPFCFGRFLDPLLLRLPFFLFGELSRPFAALAVICFYRKLENVPTAFTIKIIAHNVWERHVKVKQLKNHYPSLFHPKPSIPCS
jgi:hypothetical protein